MLTIRSQQISALESGSWRAFEAQMLDHVREHYRVDYALLGDQAMRVFLHAATLRVERRGHTQLGQACRHIGLMLSLGSEFDRDPQLGFLPPVRGDGGDAVSQFESFYLAALGYLERVAGEDGARYLRVLVKARALSVDGLLAERGDFEQNLTAVLGGLHRAKLREIGARVPTFASTALALAQEAGMGSPGPRMVYAVFMFLLGARFARDPLYPWAAQALEGARRETAEGKARALFLAGQTNLGRALALLRPEH